MTDEQIIKALECCSKITFSCDGCPLKHLKYSECYEFVIRSALDLINRQKADILSLQNKVELLEQDKKMSKEDSDKSKAAAMEVIKKQEAEIERLKHLEKNVYEAVEELTNKIKAEAVKEFAEELIYKIVNTPTKFESTYYMYREGIAFRQNEIIDIIKEMVGEEK